MSKNISSLAQKAKMAALKLATLPSEAKNEAMRAMAQALLENQAALIKANQKDLVLAEKQKLPRPVINRLILDEKGIKDMAQGLEETARLKDPVGEEIASWTRPNGLLIKKVRVPIGVIAIIYESRPNVTSDCVGLGLKSGNAVILKGGRETAHSNQAVFSVLKSALKKTSVPSEAIQMIDSTDRDSVKILLKQDKFVDLVIPRGGEGLIRFVVENAHIPVIKQYKGVCHTYVSSQGNQEDAIKICLNAKVQKPAVCNAMETLLVDAKIAKEFLPKIVEAMQKAGVEVRGDPKVLKLIKGLNPVKPEAWSEEYLDLILSVKVVDGVQEAIDHINKFGSHHSETIVTEDKAEAERFLSEIDSACLYVNASTRFTDGFQFGFGAEVGISTDKLHARGPMGLDELTAYKYLIYGSGQIRS